MSFPIPVLDGILNIGGKLIERLFPDPAARDAAKLELLKMQQAGEFKQMEAELQMAQMQVDVNKVEAAAPDFFTRGWRPAIGWVCVAGCGWNWVGLPVAKLLIDLAGHQLQLEMADVSEMLPLLLGMLGLGAMRTTEKIKGATR